MPELCPKKKKKEERKEKQYRKEESKQPRRDPQAKCGTNSDLSFRPSLWLSSWAPVTKANLRHQRRIGGMAQLLRGWLEFPVAFLTDAVREVQACNNSDWGRMGPEQSQGGGVGLGRDGRCSFPLWTEKRSLSFRIFRWKASKGLLVPVIVNVERQAYCIFNNIYIQMISHSPSEPSEHPAGFRFSFSISFAWDRFGPRWWNWMFWNWKVQSQIPKLPLD